MPTATVTSKGQVTIPKKIRDELKLGSGTKIDFVLQPDGTVLVKPVTVDIRDLRSILKSPLGRSLTVEEMDAAIAAEVVKKFRRSAR